MNDYEEPFHCDEISQYGKRHGSSYNYIFIGEYTSVPAFIDDTNCLSFRKLYYGKGRLGIKHLNSIVTKSCVADISRVKIAFEKVSCATLYNERRVVKRIGYDSYKRYVFDQQMREYKHLGYSIILHQKTIEILRKIKEEDERINDEKEHLYLFTKRGDCWIGNDSLHWIGITREKDENKREKETFQKVVKEYQNLEEMIGNSGGGWCKRFLEEL